MSTSPCVTRMFEICKGLKSPAVRKKVAGAPKKTSKTSPPNEKIQNAGFNVFSLRSATVNRHKPNSSVFHGFGNPASAGIQKESNSFQVPFGVSRVAVAKTGQLAFLREDKKGVVITDEDGRIQHEVKEPLVKYLAISCTESDALYVLSASWGSCSVTLTKHSLDDGRVLEYIFDKLDGVEVNKGQVMANYGNDLVAVIIGKEIRIFKRKEWTVLDDYDDYESDDSDL